MAMARIQMDLRAVLLEIHGALFAHALIGGLALAAHGAGRATALDLLADGERAEDVDRILREHGYECLLRNQYVGNYLGPTPERGRVDVLCVRRTRGRAILERAVPHAILGASLRVVDASDLIGLKVQSLSNDQQPFDVGEILVAPQRAVAGSRRCARSSGIRSPTGAPGAETTSACSGRAGRMGPCWATSACSTSATGARSSAGRSWPTSART
jgi:hypothetical protein